MNSVTFEIGNLGKYEDIPKVSRDKITMHRSSKKPIVAKIAEDCLNVPLNISESLIRIAIYISRNPAINDLTDIKVVDLLNYFYEQKSYGFRSLTFQQTIKDIKNLMIYLTDYKEVKNAPHINFAIQNHRFWNK